MEQPVFDDLTDIYDAMIDWEKRLGNEEPFYRELFERAGARHVLDAACGTGRHAAMFHGWGLQVEGADISAGMVERARANFGEPSGLRWVVRGFDQPIPAREPFDAAICVGNSLALAAGGEQVQKAVREMMNAVRAGGVLVLHVLNLWRMPDGPCVWQKCKRSTSGEEELLILKGVHRCGSRGYVELVVVPLGSPGKETSDSVCFLGLEATNLERIASDAGATNVEVFGSYDRKPYRRDESVDLIIVAQK